MDQCIVLGAGCCEKKVVGGSIYTLIGEEDTSTFSCMDKCTYSKEGEANSKYCFAAGDLQVECKGSSTATAGGATPATAGGSAPTPSGGSAPTPSGGSAPTTTGTGAVMLTHCV